MDLSSFIEILVIYIGLAMDAFAVSIASGTLMKKMHLHHVIRIALFFGVFQAIMPILGWLGGSLFADKIALVSHWIAFILLALIGGKMVKESFDDESSSFNPLDVYVIFTLAIATSIDALAVGITFSVLTIPIWSSALIIGVVTFVISLMGVILGDKVGEKIGSRAELFGGVILIGIGSKILLNNLL